MPGLPIDLAALAEHLNDQGYQLLIIDEETPFGPAIRLAIEDGGVVLISRTEEAKWFIDHLYNHPVFTIDPADPQAIDQLEQFLAKLFRLKSRKQQT